MPKVYKSKLKPVIRTVTSVSGKTFKRVYYEKDESAVTQTGKLKPKSKKPVVSDEQKNRDFSSILCSIYW